MKLSLHLTIANTCYAIVAGEFATFCNEKYRGRNFSWKNFPDMAARRCETSIYMYLDKEYSDVEMEKIRKLANAHGKEIGETLVNRAEFS